MPFRIFIIAAVMLSATCDKDGRDARPGPIEQLIFGVGFVECGGDCARIYKIEGEQLFEDEGINYITSVDQEFRFMEEPLGEEQFQSAQVLLETFPSELWVTEEGLIGQPNAHDQGGIILEVKGDGLTKRWYIDFLEERQPDYLIPYTRKIKAVIEELVDQ